MAGGLSFHDIYARRKAASSAAQRGRRDAEPSRSGPPYMLTDAHADAVYAKRRRETQAARAEERRTGRSGLERAGVQ